MLGATSTTRALGVFEQLADDEELAAIEQARAGAIEAAANRLSDAALAMGAAPDDEDALDPYTRRIMLADITSMTTAVQEQNRQVDLAEDAGDRSGRAVLGLSLVALAGVLIGLAAVLGRGRGGRIALSAGTIALVLATVAGTLAAV